MTRHAKASSAGSTQGQGNRSGSFVRGAGATRDTSSDANGSGARSIGPVRLTFVLCLSIVAALALCASSALAQQTHPYTGTSFGPDGVGGSESFERVQSIAVDPANGDTYVYDGGAEKVYKFDSAGAPVEFSATGNNAISGVGLGFGGAEYEIALAPAGSPGGTAGDIYVANNGNAIHVYSAAGAELGEVEQGGETCGVATDPSGNFYAGVYSSTINKFTPSANPPVAGDLSGTGTVEHGICNVAADGLGNVYAANFSAGVYQLEGIADTTPTLIDSAANTMAIAPGSNDLYADHGNEIFQYDSSGTPIGGFGNGEISESHGVAVNSGATKIYVGTPGKVKVFGPATTVPDAITEAADAITRNTAALHGTVGAAGGPEATCVFQYTSTSAYFEHGFEGASEAPCNPAGPFSGSGTTPVSAGATGLSAETNYRFRLLASSSNGSNGGAVLSFSTPGAINVQTDPATNITASGATLNGTINPEGTEPEECAFEYRTGFGSFTKVPCAESPATIGSGNSPVSVHLDLSELVGGTEYQFRLFGKNEFGSKQGGNEFFNTNGPSLGSVSVGGVSETSATFHATVNPNGVDTSYVFEYVTQADFEASGFAGATSVPLGGESIGAGTANVEVSATAEGLEPKGAYRFRVSATSADGTSTSSALPFATFGPAPVFGPCPNDRFRTGPSAKLPDCRAYEQATPTDKYGSDVSGNTFGVQAASSGDAVTFYTFAGFPGPEHFAITNVLLSRFDGAKWSTAGLANPPSYGNQDNTLGWTSDLRLSFGIPRVGGGAPGNALVMRDSATGARTVLIPQGAGFTKGPSQERLIGGVFDDDSKVLFAANGDVPVTSGPAPLSMTKANVYLYDRDTGELTLAGLLPDSACATPPCVPAAGSQFPFAFGTFAQDGNVVSTDGDVYFIDSSGQLYLRRDAAGPGATTVQVSASQKTNGGGSGGSDPNGPQPVEFSGATPSGSKALFMSKEELTNDASTGGDETQDLYAYDKETGGLTDLAPGGKVIGVLGYSNDASSVYFAANGDLDGAGPAQAGNCEPANSEGGSCSVYLWQAEGTGGCTTTGGCTSFVFRSEAGFGNGDYNWYSSLVGDMKTARVSSDGSTLVFSSRSQLTAYDNQGTAEFYRYEATSGQISCLTCSSSGVPPVGKPDLKNGDLYHAPGTHLSFKAQRFLSRNLSPDGKRFFFQSPDKLVPADVNGEVSCGEEEETQVGSGPSCEDVYEWEAPGEGSCTEGSSAYSPVNGGCIYLLSTGTGIYPSYLADVSESGDTAFIYSRQKLVPSDEDNQEDIYAVKVDGGLAYQHEARPASCEGDACRGASSKPSSAPGAGTAAFEGPGNPKSNINKTRCPKGKRTVHSKGKVRCVAKKHKKHAKKHKSKSHKRAANNNRRASR
ncbi:MAG TPA: hypothetical protein VG816_14600 [Solirubrobacterales bacterium]|nr:hypothetical protein [Solirubrobacterales bacterium]